MRFKKLLFIKILILLNLLFTQSLFADNHNIYETLELIQKDIKTLEKAVYSGTIEINNNTSNLSNFDNNSEDVLTRHLLKLSEIENQFQQLTNKFEEINFKLDKLSNRLSKVQADNQVRFQDLEAAFNSGEAVQNITKNIDARKYFTRLINTSRFRFSFLQRYII
jgi:TolA-binding protein